MTTPTNIVTYWAENIEIGAEFGDLPRLYCPNHYVAIRECFIEWSEPQDVVIAVLSSTLVDKGPANPNQEVHLIVQAARKSRFYHTSDGASCHQPIRYRITNYDLDLSHFKIELLNVKNKSPAPKIKRISLKLDITPCTHGDTRFPG